MICFKVIKWYIKEGIKLPKYDEHIRKYNDNKNLLNTKLNISNGEFYNWIVTVSFYAAMHLVESELAKYNFDSYDHKARGNNIDRFNQFKPIRNKYKILYDRSRVARYDATFMNEEKARFVLKCLNDIEEQLHIDTEKRP